MEYKKMHDVNNIQFKDAVQSKAIYKFKNTAKTLCRTNTASCYTKMFKIEDF
jgi:hypothetical protein